ncbi:lipopolysaccharide heptosyltransferase I [Denitratisoma sp. DHT3]|uniref:lipopolysaccharide heptosyltransferase I n=1 Tax=Denitratisoma sp. DHT3 TaxID=1981880 RepID=UPI0011984F50|nr:lipopolysaccharide heptosyltransferase I [Denitratisoma sp. DHT3]QDX81833.1 lipopolysaccharide heptosyltransferase I [Denitratisoma sp. DHT3]
MRILLIKTSSLGDVVHNLPLVTDLARRRPDARIDWMVEEGFVDIPRLHPAVRRVIPVALRRWRGQLLRRDTWREIAAFRALLRAEAYDVVLDSQGLIKSALLTAQARLAPGGTRCGYGREAAREPLAARAYDRGFGIPRNAHAVERNRWLAAAAFGYTPDLPLDYGIAAPPLAADWLPAARAYAVLLTGTSRADKLWPEAHWVELMRALAGAGLRAVLPAGSGEERQRAARLAAAVPGALAAPPLAVAQLAGLFAGAALVVGLDTGLTHLAAALDRPTVALFAGSDPELTGVHAGPRAVNLGRPGAAPTPAEAIEAARRLLTPVTA